MSAIPAGLLSMTVVLLLMPPFIRFMQRKSWGQEIRPEGPQDHFSKRGTPTMGGLVILTTLAVAFFLTPKPSPHLAVFAVMSCACAFLGFIDDWLKVAKRRNLGFKARQKLAGQLLLGVALGVYLTSYSGLYQGGRDLPGLVGTWLFTMLVTAAATNAVNLTDGLDGLAAGTSLMALGAYALISWKAGLPEIATGCVSLAGGCLGFLWFNAFPARIFMGDTGSLALGGALATAAILTRTEWLFVLIGGVFVAEALSVILQVLWFKMTKGGRIFKMSPLHHHFTYDSKDPSERPPHILKGREWHEVQTSTRFSLTALVLAALGVLIYFRG